MNVTLTRKNSAVHFEGVNSEGKAIHFDGPASIGGEGKGIRPMEGVLLSLAGCSAIDVVEMLKKMRQNLENLSIEVEGERREEIPRIFTHIHLKYILSGQVEKAKAEKVVQLSADKYCSVSKMLEPDVKITHEVLIEN